jgi:autotransporter adhesin
MTRKHILCACALVLAPFVLTSTSQAQSREFGARSIVLDDNAGHRLRISPPVTGWPATGTFDWVLPFPPAGVAAGFVGQGSADNKYLMWDLANSYWKAVPTLPGVMGTGTPNTLTKWSATGDALANTSLVEDANVLTMSGNSLLLTGTTGSAPASGEGTRLMWIPELAAFRAGAVTGVQWDEANIGELSFAVGHNTTASGINSTAMGDGSTASGDYSLAIGIGANASNEGANAVGQNQASGAYSTALGFISVASGPKSATLGVSAEASGINSLALGTNSLASGTNAAALGSGSDASGIYSIAFGHSTTASNEGSVALGSDATASGEGAVALGASTASGLFATAGGNSTSSNEYTTAIGRSSTASGFTAVAIGEVATASGDYATAIGIGAMASDEGANAIGQNTASGAYSTALGFISTASGPKATALGVSAEASGINSLALGTNSNATNTNAVALGSGSEASAFNAMAFGPSTTASANNALAMGTHAGSLHAGAFVFGDISTSTDVVSTTSNQFVTRFDGGYLFYTNAAMTAGVLMNSGDNSWSSISDSNRKENRLNISGEAVLNKLSNIWLGSWNYKSQDKSMRHYGPMAQEFFAAFGDDGIGIIGNDTTLATADVDGVTLIAVKGLDARTREMQNEMRDIRTENAMLRKQNATLMSKLVTIERTLDTMNLPKIQTLTISAK